MRPPNPRIGGEPGWFRMASDQMATIRVGRSNSLSINLGSFSAHGILLLTDFVQVELQPATAVSTAVSKMARFMMFYVKFACGRCRSGGA